MATNTKFVQMKTTTLKLAITDTDTEAIFNNFIDLSGVPLVQTDFGDLGFGTLEPNTSREEPIAFTVDANTTGEATLTLVRGYRGKHPYGAGGTAFNHQAGSELVISNNPALFNKLTAKDNDEVISASWQFPTPVNDNNPVTKTFGTTTYVQKTGNETVAGIKTFSSAPKMPDAAADDEALTKGQYDTTTVKLTGAQTVAGVKTFSSSPIVPDATTAQQPFTKGQFDAAVEAAAATATDVIRGTVKLDAPATDPANPIVVSRSSVINESERSVDPADDAGKVVQLEVDGFVNQRFIRAGDFGDGVDGDVTISSETTLTRNMHYNNLVVNATLNTNGYLIYVKGTLSGTGKVKGVTGTNGANASGSPGGGGGASGGAGPLKTTSGGNGATGSSAAGPSASTATFPGIGEVGSTGGNGGSTAGGFTAGGNGGGNVLNRMTFPFGILKATTYLPVSFEATGLSYIFGTGQAGGGGGGGGNGGSAQGAGGGGGGASGGTIFVACNELSGSLTFESLGGNGGNGADGVSANRGGGGGGAGGNGGSLLLMFNAKITSYTQTLTGGGAGNGGLANGTGVNGQNGESGKVGIVKEVIAYSLS